MSTLSPSLFYDRESQQAELYEQLKAHQSVIGIYGRAGMGKTALLKQVYQTIQTQPDYAGVIYLSVNGRPVLTVGSIFEKLATFLPANHPFNRTYKDPKVSTKNKTREMLKAMQGGQYVVCLDTLETMQDLELHYVTDDGIRDFLGVLLEMGQGQPLTVILTSRYLLPFSNTRPLSFPTDYESSHHPIVIEDGLPIDDALKFMTEIDSRKFLPTLNADLKVWWHKVHGVPRGLEALVQYLYKQQSHDIEDLLNMAGLFDRHAIMNLVEKVHQSLPNVLNQILQAMAMIGQFCTQEELSFTISPYLDIIHLPLLLKDLRERRLVIYDEAQKTYSLPSSDIGYLQQSLPVGSVDDIPKPDPLLAFYEKIGKTPPPEVAKTRNRLPFSQYALTHRIAEYYLQKRKPKVAWQTIEDIMPQLREIDYRMALGDYDSATNILLDIGFDYLHQWGYVELSLRLHTHLEGKIKNPTLALAVMMNLGGVYRQMDNPEMARQKYQVALEMAQAQGNRAIEGQAAGAIGVSYYETGQLEFAMTYYEKALAISREVNDKVREGGWLGNMANANVLLGKMQKALEYYEQARLISNEIRDDMRESGHLNNMGVVYEAIGEIEKAITYTREALKISQRIKDKRGEGIRWGNIGDYLSILGHYQDAVFNLQESIKILLDIKMIALAQERQYVLVRAYWLMGDLEKAIQTLDEARIYDIPSNELVGLSLEGCIRYCLGDKIQAQKAFNKVISLAHDGLTDSSANYQTVYTQALAQVGLWLIEGDIVHYNEALTGYKAGLSILDSVGVRRREKQVLDALLACSTERDGTELLDLLEQG